ncbi:WD40-like Beta Propeller [Marssonina coronariae]|uniref:WD40-like Beta Propeller n=1 Tax=Diplocarpon coronariae TaxID=2795749 RepID=A0A218Z2Z8_9HELO|nr:WD40-like Beta Propeller [Marssonina coronariae]
MICWLLFTTKRTKSWVSRHQPSIAHAALRQSPQAYSPNLSPRLNPDPKSIAVTRPHHQILRRSNQAPRSREEWQAFREPLEAAASPGRQLTVASPFYAPISARAHSPAISVGGCRDD